MSSICFILFLLISILSSSYGQVTCPSGWVQNGGSCYLMAPLFNTGGPNNGYTGSWDQCNAYCTASYPGATMLCVSDAAENAGIKSNLQVLAMWIGYTDMPPYGGGTGTKQYGWVTGCSSTYTNWRLGQPDNWNNNEDYAAMHASGGWMDFSSQDKYLCGCEYSPASQGSGSVSE
jgi:hypothetical protein